MFSRDLDPVFSEIVQSQHHRFLITTFKLDDEEYRVVNLYLPTSDKGRHQVEIIVELDTLLDVGDGAHLFLGGF